LRNSRIAAYLLTESSASLSCFNQDSEGYSFRFAQNGVASDVRVRNSQASQLPFLASSNETINLLVMLAAS